VHQLGHELSGRFNVSHGASLTTMWGAWANYCKNVDINRFAKYAKAVWHVCRECTHNCKESGCNHGLAADAGIEKTLAFFKSIEMPTCFTELGIGIQSDDVLNELSDSCVFYGSRLVGNFKQLNKDDVLAIYKLANK